MDDGAGRQDDARVAQGHVSECASEAGRWGMEGLTSHVGWPSRAALRKPSTVGRRVGADIFQGVSLTFANGTMTHFAKRS